MRIESVCRAGKSTGKSIGEAIFRLSAFGALLVAFLTTAGPLSTFGQDRSSDDGDVAPLVERGIVIANGVYLSSPYQIDLVGQELHINGLAFKPEDLDLTEFEQVEFERNSYWNPHRGDKTRRSRRFRKMPDPIEELRDACLASAQMRGIIVLSNGHVPLLLERSRCGADFLIELLRKDTAGPSTEHQIVALPAELSAPEYRVAWDHAIAEFKPCPEFRTRARGYVAEIDAADESSERIVKASLWADSISYPLTLFAMIVVVVAFGHLLSNKPRLEEAAPGSGVSPETQKVVLKSLLIFGLLSVVDLIWTISANATGSMREMNPIGNELIHDPVRLILFKTFAVSVTIGLLYSLHRRPIAQVASWWSCLVLTLLTARWLTFHSMFM